MSNEILFILTILINFIGITAAYKFFKKTGLFVWISIATIISNIEVVKCIDMFGMSVTLGNVIYGTVFLATDALSELYGGKEARKGVIMGFFSMIVFTILSQISLLYTPNSQDFANESMKTIFSLMPRLCIASMVTYLISNTLDTYLYDWIRKKLPEDKWLWIRNNGSTMVSQLIDSFLFTILAFGGVFEIGTVMELSITTYVIKFVIAICDTPFMYFIKQIGEGKGNKVKLK